jgi:hypothetical protein
MSTGVQEEYPVLVGAFEVEIGGKLAVEARGNVGQG